MSLVMSVVAAFLARIPTGYLQKTDLNHCSGEKGIAKVSISCK